MDEADNVIIAKFCGGSNRTTTKAKWKYDYGQILKFEGLSLPETYQVHISNDEFGVADIYIGDANGVEIPHKYFYSGLPIYVWIFLHVGENDGETKYLVTIPIMDRAYPYADPPTEEQYILIQQLLNLLSSSVTSAQTAAESAQQDALLSKSYAVGGTGTREGEDTDNAKFYSEQAEASEGNAYQYMEQVQEAEQAAQEYAQQAQESEFYAQQSAESAAASAEAAEAQADRADHLMEKYLSAFPVDTASGAIATFPDGADDIPVKSLVAEIVPTQDFNGYDHPWTGGEGRNKFDTAATPSYRVNVTWESDMDSISVRTVNDTYALIEYYSEPFAQNPEASVFEGTDIYVDFDQIRYGDFSSESQIKAATVNAAFYDGTSYHDSALLAEVDYENNGASVHGKYKIPYADVSKNWQAAVKIRWFVHSGTIAGSAGSEMVLSNISVSPDAAGYTPYENICPIMGRASTTVTRIGANFLRSNPTVVNGTIAGFADGEYTFTVSGSGLSYVSYPLPDNLAGKTVYLSGIVRRTGEHANNFAARIVRRLNGVTGYQNFALYTDNEAVYSDGSITIPEDASNILMQVVAAATVDSSAGETMTVKDLRLCLTAGQPYTDYQRDVYTDSFGQTVYGGSVDVVSGELTVTHGEIASYDGETINEPWISDRDVYVEGTTPSIGAQVVYPLSDPIETQLTSQDVNTLLGQNNIWADTGDANVTYRADTALYIDKRLAESE